MIRDILHKEIGKAFGNELQDTVTTFSGERSTKVKDKVNGTINTLTERYSGRGVFSFFGIHRVDGVNVLADDRRLLILSNEVTLAPKVGDKINGYNVIRVTQDAALATYKLQLRRI